MSSEADSTLEPDEEITPYEPFPAFNDFIAALHYDPSLVDSTSEHWSAVREQTDDTRSRQVVEMATRWAAVDTGAIEDLYNVDRDFTFNIATSAEAIQGAHEAIGDDGVNHILDALNAYDHVQVLVHEDQPITETWVRELHELICASQETYEVYIPGVGLSRRPLIKGAYKTEPNRSRSRKQYFAPPGDDTSAEMARMVSELRSENFVAAHPILQAAYAHYAFVTIHPFPDGNGRVARALASAYLYRRPGVPLVIFADQKGVYIGALKQADAGDYSPFVRFLSEVTVDAIGMLTLALDQPELDEPADIVADLARSLVSQDGLEHAQVYALEQRVREAWLEALQAEIEKLPPIEPMVLQLKNDPQGVSNPDRNYRTAPNSKVFSFKGTVPPPAEASFAQLYAVRIPKAETGMQHAFEIFENGGNNVYARVDLRDVHPTVTGALGFKLSTIARTHVRSMLTRLRDSGRDHMKNTGYI